MSHFKTWRRLLRGWRLLPVILAIYLAVVLVVRIIVPPPAAVGLAGPMQIADSVTFLHDDSWTDANQSRQVSQQIFDAMFDAVRQAERFVLLDMFLFNDWQGPVAETHRALSGELTDVLIKQKNTFPEMDVIVVTDPINTVYGGLESPHLKALRAAGIHVVLTRLDRLQDSNPLWSGFWRVALAPFGNDPGDLLPNPFGEGRVSLRSYLALFNFKANHRKLLIADQKAGALQGLVSSANPHDGSSAHRNVAIQFDGPAVTDLLNGERALLSMSDAETELQLVDRFLASYTSSQVAVQNDADTQVGIQILSESRIHDAILSALASAQEGSAVNLAMFYLSERSIISALKQAQARGAQVRVLLDVNNDAFGRAKNGVPNRPVAAELAKAGIQIRWCATSGEQCHAKWLHTTTADSQLYLLGSANYTRRNLLDLNMETNVLVMADNGAAINATMAEFFERQWNNADSRTYSVPYEEHADNSGWLKLQYRIMEATGLSTF